MESESGVQGPWRHAAKAAGLLAKGIPSATIFEQMTQLAHQHQAVNLGQGFPDLDGPQWIRQHAAEHILSPAMSGANQYAPGNGLPELRSAISDHLDRHYGIQRSPDTDILVTTGATEGIAASILALVNPGDDVITFEPFYDSYAAMIALAGANHVVVPLEAPHFLPDPARLAEAITEKTRMVILNTPHNPTGTVIPRKLIDDVVAVCERAGVWLLSDEVYEHLVYDGEHVPPATAVTGGNYVITVSSAGKTFSLTGWKVGWVVADAEVVTAIRAVKQFLTFSSGPAFQYAVAQGLREGDTFLRQQRDQYRRNRDILLHTLRTAGLRPVVPQAGYFVVADLTPWGILDAALDAPALARQKGIVGIPVSALCRPTTANASHPAAPDSLASWLRLAFCKTPDTLAQAAQRLQDAVAG